MSFIQMYLEPEDVNILFSWLNNDDEIAFFKSKGLKKWIAVKTIDKLKIQNMLWHIPYKNLPLVKGYPKEPGIIENPWEGWEEIHENKNSFPYFGPGCPGIISLYINVNRFYIDENNKPVDAVLISHFGWIGNFNRVLGNPALKETELWWKNLRKKIKSNSQIITLHYDNKGGGYKKSDVYAFPHALKAIENGKTVLNQPYINIPKMTYEK